MHLFNQDRLRLLITDSCNLSCTYCHNEGQFGHGTFMSLESVVELSSWLTHNSVFVKSLILSGGEPSIHPQLLDIVQALRGTAKSLSMVSNGIRLNSARIDALAQAGMKYIKFGIDAVDGVETKGPLDRTSHFLKQSVLENALYAVEVMPGSHLNTVVSSFNASRIRRLLEWCDEKHIGVKFLELIEVRPQLRTVNPFPQESGHSWFARLYDETKDLLSDVEYNPEVMKFYARTRSGQTVQFSENFCLYGACSRLWTRMDSSRRLVPCINRPVTRELALTPKGVTQTTRVNKEMTDVSAWPCGETELKTNGVYADGSGMHIVLRDGSTVEFPLTGRTSCAS